MSIALLLAEPDVALATEIKQKLVSNSVPHEVLSDSKNWVSQIQNKKFSHVILNYELEKDITDLLLSKLEADHGRPKVILVVSEKQKPFVKKSILENANICQILPFPYTIQQVLNCIEDKKIGPSKYMTVRTLAIKVMEEIYTKGLSDQNIKYAHKVAESITSMVQKEKDHSEIIKTFDNYNPIIYVHPYLVCVISMMICRKLKWDSQRTVSAVALGALIHDIGMIALDPELRIKPPESMTPQELKTYQNHPIEGMQIANTFGSLPSAVLQIILQHHESNGKGFPGEISNAKIYPLAKVVALSDRFTRYLINNDLPPIVGLKKFLSDRMEILQHDPEMVKALIKSFIKDDKSDSKESA